MTVYSLLIENNIKIMNTIDKKVKNFLNSGKEVLDAVIKNGETFVKTTFDDVKTATMSNEAKLEQLMKNRDKMTPEEFQAEFDKLFKNQSKDEMETNELTARIKEVVQRVKIALDKEDEADFSEALENKLLEMLAEDNTKEVKAVLDNMTVLSKKVVDAWDDLSEVCNEIIGK